MATEQRLFNVGTLVAATDLRTAQFTFVKLDATGKVIACAILGEKAIGVLQNKPNIGETADIAVAGVTKLVASAVITAGDKLMTAANGQGATAATLGSSIVGFATEAAGAAGQIITAVVVCATGVV